MSIISRNLRDEISIEITRNILFMNTAISIRQPWVELILQGYKTIEVRSWATQHRGELWLHAGLRPDRRALERFNLSASELSFGALVGRCDIYDCIEFNEEAWHSLRNQHLNDGQFIRPLYAWLLRNPIRIAPKVLKGRLGLMKIAG